MKQNDKVQLNNYQPIRQVNIAELSNQRYTPANRPINSAKCTASIIRLI